MTSETRGPDPKICTDAVVVGFDGSEDATKAVLWAQEDAVRRGVPLVVLRAWSLKTAPRPAGVDFSYVPSEDEFAAAVRDDLVADLAAVLGPDAVAAAVPLAVHRSADDALVEASRYAAVTVVGARGSGLARWMGSVSTSVVRHADGPVVVVPQEGERGS